MITNHVPLRLEKFSVGVGDRFSLQAEAQLRACMLALDAGTAIIPVWNKSNREHTIIGSEPSSVRMAAKAAVDSLDWTRAWHVDADHIRMDTVDRFLADSDFFTIDVADAIGKPARTDDVKGFIDRHPELIGHVALPGNAGGVRINRTDLEDAASTFLAAVQEAGAIYRHIERIKGAGNFITEVSMDETGAPQTPGALLIILAALADEGIPVQTIAPRFSGRFNKGVDYVGDVSRFEREFSDDLSVIEFAVTQYGLPDNLKLSVHSGSDKFAIYGPIHRALSERGAGLHLKTAGTTWLEEVIGLAESGGEGLALAKEIYADAVEDIDELCAPYAAVIDIGRADLPSAVAVAAWSSEQFVNALRHDPGSPEFNRSLRQLVHVGFKIAARKGQRYRDLVKANEAIIARNVTHNLFDRHLKPLFLGV